ncbi:hypothetical protein PILCRDRAFT_127951 [Piloderma croceum F 1598]|uniref:Uncharacterized protein n=1 Tax=Piloderma croceum (strain F 1598) TaxID=765440 RepID=A0A0C3BXT4_PILCF|nr:hypothetical protein PILCRDRAFT_127951 [Piloderma croceum F 1598]
MIDRVQTPRWHHCSQLSPIIHFGSCQWDLISGPFSLIDKWEPRLMHTEIFACRERDLADIRRGEIKHLFVMPNLPLPASVPDEQCLISGPQQTWTRFCA